MVAHSFIHEPATAGIKAFPFGGVHAALGELDQAFDCLGTAATDHSSSLPEFYSDPMFDALRKDTRSGQLMKKIGLG